MSQKKDPKRRFRESLDSSLLKTTCKLGTTAHKVESSLLRLVDDQIGNSGDSYTATSARKTAARIIRVVMEAWSPIDLDAGCPLVKFDLGYAVKQATASRFASGNHLVEEIVKCITVPFREVHGSHVPAECIRDVLQAAGKVYLAMAQAIEDEDRVMAPTAQARYSTSLKPIFDRSETTEDIKLVHTIDPRHEDYDPVFPTFTKSSPGVLGLGACAVKPTTPQKQAKGKGRLLADPSQPKITSMFKGRMTSSSSNASSKPDNPPPILNEQQVQPLVCSLQASTPANATSPTKSVDDGGTPNSSPGSGPGNHAHGPPVPWLQDEEDYIKGLIVITRGKAAWQELADASNDYFRDKPISRKKTGEVIQRGNRGMQGLRQNPAFKGYEKQDWWYRLDEEWRDVGGPSPVIEWAGFGAEPRAKEHANADVIETTANAADEGGATAEDKSSAFAQQPEQESHAVDDSDGISESEAEEMPCAAYTAAEEASTASPPRLGHQAGTHQGYPDADFNIAIGTEDDSLDELSGADIEMEDAVAVDVSDGEVKASGALNCSREQ